MSRTSVSNDKIRTRDLGRGVLRVAGAEGTASGSALAESTLLPEPTRQQRHPSARRKAQSSECCMSASFVAATLDRTRHLEADSRTLAHQVTSYINSGSLKNLSSTLLGRQLPLRSRVGDVG